jgi:pyruvate formate lyase activating enzyme
MHHEAWLYEKEGGGAVRCGLCAHRCRIAPGKRGLCSVRENRDGTLVSLVYGLLIAEHVDPIEKKPFFHVLPGSRSYSIATAGCNFRCAFCQNHEISQLPREGGRIVGQPRLPEEVVGQALAAGCQSIAYTYTEPTVYSEFADEVAAIAHEQGLKNLLVTNGYRTEALLERMAPHRDGANVDLKSFQDAFYRKQCGARLQPVLDSLRKMKELGIWVEVTTLLIPGLNDRDGELGAIARFIAALGPETPWHVSRFFPRYQMTGVSPTPEASLQRAAAIGAEAGLFYVYCGNAPGGAGETTFCARCGYPLIERCGFAIQAQHLVGTACPHCGTALEGRLG